MKNFMLEREIGASNRLTRLGYGVIVVKGWRSLRHTFESSLEGKPTLLSRDYESICRKEQGLLTLQRWKCVESLEVTIGLMMKRWKEIRMQM